MTVAHPQTSRGHGDPHARTHRRESGVAAMEFVGILPMALLAIAVVVQLTLGVHAVQSVNNAARQAARAYSLDQSPTRAAQDTLPGGIRLVGSVQTFGPRHGARVTVEVPRITHLLPPWQVSRDAVMP